MMAVYRESKSIVSMHELDDESFSNALEQLSMGCGNPWNDKMQAMLENSHSKTIMETLEYYRKSLKEQLNGTKDKVAKWKELKTMILSHLLIIKMKFYELDINLTSTITSILEEVLAIYCNVELKLLGMLYKDNEINMCDLDAQFNIQSKQILSKLKHTFHWENLNAVHCLLHVEFDEESLACVALVKIMYNQILFTKTISTMDDMDFCGYYLLYCKYQRMILSEDSKELLLRFLDRFNKNIEFLNDCCLLREIQSNSNNDQHQIVENYFKYIRAKELLKEQNTHTGNVTEDICNNRISFQEKCSGNTFEITNQCSDVTYWYDNEDVEDAWENNLDDKSEEMEYERSKDERIITLVQTISDDSMEEAENTDLNENVQDERRTIFLVECADSPSSQESQGLPGIVCGEEEIAVKHKCKPEKYEHIKLERQISLTDERNQEDTIDSETQHILADVTKGRMADNLVVTKQEKENAEEVIVEKHCESEEILDCNMSAIRFQSLFESGVQHYNNTYINEEEAIPVDCEKQIDYSQNNLICQLEEYLSISKPVAVDETVEHVEESQVTGVDQTESNEEGPLTLVINKKSNAFIDCKPVLGHHKLLNYEEHRINIAVPDEASKYLFEFGYETPPKDGTCEPEFHMVASTDNEAEDMEENIGNDNGFLTPENEIAGNMLPIAVPHYSEDAQQNFSFRNNCEALYPPATGSHPGGLTTAVSGLIYEGTLDLSTNARNSAKTVLDDIRMSNVNHTREKSCAVTEIRGVTVQKYQCNTKLIEKMTMPSSFEDNLLNTIQSQPPGCKTSLSKAKKQLLSSLDMDIERAFADLIHTKIRTEKKTQLMHTHQSSAVYCNKNSTLTDSSCTTGVDPKLFRMKPIVDLSSFRPEIPQGLDLRSQQPHEEEVANNSNGIQVLGGETEMKADATDDEISAMLQTVQPGIETRLPFKKRRMTVPLSTKPPEDVERAEISYPATPMLSIAELAAVQPNPGQMLPAHDGSAYLNETSLECQSTVGVEINYNLNAYPYNVMPCAPAYFDIHYINAQQGNPYFDPLVKVDYDPNEKMYINRHYFCTETIEP